TRNETGRAFTIKLNFEDGRTNELIIKGGKADPNLRMPEARLLAKWMGQDGADLCGDGPSVGPDGRLDVRIELTNMPSDIEVKALTITAPDGKSWEYGVNPEGHATAELRKSGDRKKGWQLYFQPDKDRAGQTLKVTVAYANGTKDTVS